jgi:hypothetical protein
MLRDKSEIKVGQKYSHERFSGTVYLGIESSKGNREKDLVIIESPIDNAVGKLVDCGRWFLKKFKELNNKENPNSMYQDIMEMLKLGLSEDDIVYYYSLFNKKSEAQSIINNSFSNIEIIWA